MSTWRPTVILCDAPGCKAQFVLAPGKNIPEWKYECGSVGWTAGRKHKDYCPNHKPPQRRRRSIWRLGAHAMVQEALRDGVLTKVVACEACDLETYVVAHHDDYMRPLDVRWLCEGCHQRWHREHGPGANSFVEESE